MSENRGCLSIFLPFLRKRAAPSNVAGFRHEFSAHSSLLSPAERSFYGVLVNVLKGRYIVFAKVRMCDVLKHRNQRSLNKISQKHVDFVLCTPDHVAPILAIELDDKSHDQPKRRERDNFVDAAFASAGLPLIHLPCKRAYSTGEVAAAIERAIGPVKSAQ